MKIADDITQLIGNTPLVRLSLIHISPLLAHRLGHGERAPVATRRTNHCECYPCVAARRLEDDRVRPDQPGLLGSVDHRDTNAVLHAVSRVEELQLQNDLRTAALVQATQPYERSVSDCLLYTSRRSLLIVSGMVNAHR